MQSPVTTIVFDLGRVLIDYREDRGMRDLVGLLRDADGLLLQDPAAISAFLNSASQDGVKPWQEYRTTVKPDLIPPLVQERAGPDVSLDRLRTAYCDVFDPLPERVRVFRDLIARDRAGSGPTIALLSDTIPLHIDHIESNADGLLQSLPPERRFYSFNLGSLKAEGPASYQTVARALDADPANTLMIDDTLANRDGALAAGWQFMHIQPEEDLAARLFVKHGIVTTPVTTRRLARPGL